MKQILENTQVSQLSGRKAEAVATSIPSHTKEISQIFPNKNKTLYDARSPL